MRISEAEKKVIVGAISSMDPNAEIYLFGSRVDDQQRGGDIDILCFSSEIDRLGIRTIKRQI